MGLEIERRFLLSHQAALELMYQADQREVKPVRQQQLYFSKSCALRAVFNAQTGLMKSMSVGYKALADGGKEPLSKSFEVDIKKSDKLSEQALDLEFFKREGFSHIEDGENIIVTKNDGTKIFGPRVRLPNEGHLDYAVFCLKSSVEHDDDKIRRMAKDEPEYKIQNQRAIDLYAEISDLKRIQKVRRDMEFMQEPEFLGLSEQHVIYLDLYGSHRPRLEIEFPSIEEALNFNPEQYPMLQAQNGTTEVTFTPSTGNRSLSTKMPEWCAALNAA